ncbi:hypothetical protein CCACVL1_08416 [Corchorus capsularis]|uniref:Uncharacterized protein n=1 Tax=Corchorus capsularis TaxID=210143 RepID=A0A1R3J0T4_COCAP|nr:hypothetical protein CCACVL1_08416 [Corchorus capsularis]
MASLVEIDGLAIASRSSIINKGMPQVICFKKELED